MAAMAQSAAAPMKSAAEKTGDFLQKAQGKAQDALNQAKSQIDTVTGPMKGKLTEQYNNLNSGFKNFTGQLDGAVKKMGSNIKQGNNEFKTKSDGSTKTLLEALWDYILSLFSSFKKGATALANKAKAASAEINKTPQKGGRPRGILRKTKRRRRRRRTRNKKRNKRKTRRRSKSRK